MIEGQEGPSWAERLALAQTAERLGFDGFFTSDHYKPIGERWDGGSFDSWTGLAALAARTERIRLGTLVSPVTFRHPAVLAKVASTVDAISHGRVEIGMGAGWYREEHIAHGLDFPPVSERLALLEEQVEIVHGLLSNDLFSFTGSHYRIDECAFLPRPIQRPHPPLILGGNGGPRMAALVARFADEFNTVGGTPEEVRERFTRVRQAVDSAGRDQETVSTSLMTWCLVGEDEASWKERAERARRRDPKAGSFDDYVSEIERTCIIGTPERAADRLGDYRAAGVQRVMLNHELFDDLEMLEVLAERVFPQIS
jgi:F420-dependent oxidoreductase-like protein